MASTGLLGINPYQKGVVFDISSKPLNLAIQLEQKEAAKRDALDKYYMDYEKTLNSAGMRGQDQDYFLSKLNEAKSYYLKNRDCILNPAKCGAEAQSTYMAHLKDAQSIINQSKQEAANEKADKDHFQRAIEQGLDIPEDYLPAVAKSHLPLGHPDRVPLDPYKWNFTKPFNEDAFAKTITRGLTPSVSKELSFEKPNGKGYIDKTTTFAYTPEDKLAVAKNARMLYFNDHGTTNMVNKLIKSGQYVGYQKEFNQLYPGQDITTAKPEQIAEAVGLGFTPHGKTITEQVKDEKYWADYHNKLARSNMRYQKELGLGDMSDPIQDYLNSARSGQTFAGDVGKGVEKILLPEKVVQEFKTSDNKNPVIGRGLNDGKYYSIQFQYTVDKNGKKTKTDQIDWTKTEPIPDVQIRGSVVNHVLPSNAKVKLTTGGSRGKKSIPGF